MRASFVAASLIGLCVGCSSSSSTPEGPATSDGGSSDAGLSELRFAIVGNGGAPPTGSAGYGFGLVHRRDTGVIDVDMYDYQTNQPVGGQHFALNPDGSAAQ